VSASSALAQNGHLPHLPDRSSSAPQPVKRSKTGCGGLLGTGTVCSTGTAYNTGTVHNMRGGGFGMQAQRLGSTHIRPTKGLLDDDVSARTAAKSPLAIGPRRPRLRPGCSAPIP
jgi:hypothetical protein